MINVAKGAADPAERGLLPAGGANNSNDSNNSNNGNNSNNNNDSNNSNNRGGLLPAG